MLRKPSEIIIGKKSLEEMLIKREEPLILINADLTFTDLKNVDLSYVDLSYADLRYADLRNANLLCANLYCADLRDTVLCNTNFRGTILNGIIYNHGTTFLATQCPEEGSFIGYKKASNKIIKLLILEDSKRSSATSRKCRCDKAKVLDIESLDGKEKYTEAISDYDRNFVYKVGEIVKVDNFCEDRWKECAAGIHFFITRQEAINY